MSSSATSQFQLDPKTATFLREHYAGEFERELPVTAKVISSVPASKAGYRPDEKSRTATELLDHIVRADVWFLNGIADLKFDPAAMDALPVPTDPQKAAEWYQQNVTSGMQRARALSAEQLLTPVDFFGSFNLPAVLYLGFLLKHSIHHRAQLGTYLRPMGSKVPDIYGGSADFPWEG